MQKLKNILILLSFLSFCALYSGGISGHSGVATAATSGGTCNINEPPQTDATGAPISCSCPKGYSHPFGLDGKTKITNECVQDKTASDCPSGRIDNQDPTKCAPLGSDCSNPGGTAVPAQNCLKNSPLISDINAVVNFLAAAVGVVVIAVIIIGGIQYAMAGDNASATGEAKKRIINGLIALVVFIFMYAFLQWLIPGGA